MYWLTRGIDRAKNKQLGLSLTNFEDTWGKSPSPSEAQTYYQLNRQKGICPIYMKGYCIKQMKGCETF